MRHFVVLMVCLCAFSITGISHAQNVGASGNPLPRFVSMNATEANMRTGPGRQYPIMWVYKRKHLPLEVVDEKGPWRKVRDHEGSTGWMHLALLVGRRTAMMIGGTKSLFRSKDTNSQLAITAEEGVIGHIIECADDWCQLEIDGTKGWIERHHLWGVYSREVIK